MLRQLCNLMIVFALAVPCSAGWDHLDVEAGDRFEMTMMRDYYEALRERYAATSLAWTDVTATYYWYAGETQRWATVTNDVIFAGGYTTWDGTVIYPRVTRGIVQALDARARAVASQYVQHWKADTNNSFAPKYDADVAAGCSAETPISNPAAIMDWLGIGYTTNLTTNCNGTVTGGTNEFTSQPASIGRIELAAVYTGTNGAAAWLKAMTLPDTPNYYGAELAKAWAITNAGGMAATIQGVAYGSTNRAEEAITLPASGELVLSYYWRSITNVIATTGPTNAIWAIGYNNADPFYSDIGYRISATGLVERYLFVDAMRWTDESSGIQETRHLSNTDCETGSCDEEIPGGGACAAWFARYTPWLWVSKTNTLHSSFVHQMSFFNDANDSPPDEYASITPLYGYTSIGGRYGAYMDAVYPSTNDATHIPSAAKVDVYLAATNTGNIASIATVAGSYASSIGWAGGVSGIPVALAALDWAGEDVLWSALEILDSGDLTTYIDWCAESARTNDPSGAYIAIEFAPVGAVARWDVIGGFEYVTP